MKNKWMQKKVKQKIMVALLKRITQLAFEDPQILR